MEHDLLIENALLPAPFEQGRRYDLAVRRGRIVEIGTNLKGMRGLPKGTVRLDAGGLRAAPGFIDVHVQGAGGADILDATEDALRTVASTCARFGTTGFLATTVYKKNGNNRHLQTAAQCVGSDLGGARLLGIHLEGPFISPSRRGMIQPDSLCTPKAGELDRVQKLCDGTLRMMTIAPELDGCLCLIEALVGAGCVASFGHSAATYEQTLSGIDAGLSHVTHLFNAMPAMHHRDPGPLPAIVASNVSAQLIPDGVHVYPPVLGMIARLLGPERIVAVTDGMQAMGLPDGEYLYNGIPYRSEDGTARYEDGTLIGTALGMNECVRRLREYGGLTLPQAHAAAAANPARVVGMDEVYGEIAVGREADLILLDEDLTVYATIVAGNVVYRSTAEGS
jgi:N-acetylglucosamine-6-phosphate deacetylase